jgi:hypothetical protein
MATEPELKAIIKKEKGGNWIVYYGHQIGTAKLYEIWTSTKAAGIADFTLPPDQTPQTRFWLEAKSGLKQYFEYFGDLAIHLDEYFGKLTAAKTKFEPGDLTLGQLINGLTLSQLTAVTTVIVATMVGCFLAGVYSPHFWTH